MAAVLHDTIEDTATTGEELEAQFGRTIRKIVEEMTDDKLLKESRSQGQIDHASKLSKQAKAIKLADKIANVQDVIDAPPANWDPARRIDYLDWTEKVWLAAGGRTARSRSSMTRCSNREGRSLEADIAPLSLFQSGFTLGPLVRALVKRQVNDI